MHFYKTLISQKLLILYMLGLTRRDHKNNIPALLISATNTNQVNYNQICGRNQFAKICAMFLSLWKRLHPGTQPAIRERKKHINMNKFAGLSEEWVCAKNLFVCSFRVIPCGEEKHINKIPPKSRDNPVKILFSPGSRFDPHPQRLPIFHLILGGRSESLLRKPGFPY